MHINALYDICENRYVTAITQPHPELNELAAFCQMVDQCSMPDNTIFIADRGYVSINTIAHLLDSNKFFLIRAKTPFASGSILRYVIDAEKNPIRRYLLALQDPRKENILFRTFRQISFLRKTFVNSIGKGGQLKHPSEVSNMLFPLYICILLIVNSSYRKCMRN